jgi:hypothetical protein
MRVVVDEPTAHSDYLLPFDLRMRLAKLFRDPACRFADNVQRVRSPLGLLVANASFVNPQLNSCASRAARRTSSRYASSRHIDGLDLAEEVFASNIVPASFDADSIHKIDGPTKERGEFLTHRHNLEECRRGVRLEVNEHVDIAFWAKVITRRGPEKRQLSYPMLPAKVCNGLLRDLEAGMNHRSTWRKSSVARFYCQ